MISHQFSEGECIIGKLGTNPWWPGMIKECNNKNQAFVKFFEINIESWIDTNSIIHCSSREEMEQYLNSISKTTSNNKYLNYIPSAMVDLYNEAWKTFDSKQNLYTHKDNKNSTNDVVLNKVQSHRGKSQTKDFESHPCEICLIKEVEFDCGTKNQYLTTMNENEQRKYFSRLMLTDNNNRNTKCGSYCSWKYHKDCVKDENDLVCSCNKSVWLCSICCEVINVSQLFVCNNHTCMRPYHRLCLSAHLDMSPDMKQCPLHSCINCALDYLAEPESKRVQSHLDLVSCVKCKLAFHNIIDCLPTTFIRITRHLIICHRHLVPSDLLQSNVAQFCFYCSRSISVHNPPVSCKYCLVTYHKCLPCLSGATELLDEHTFICNACKFPYVHRGQCLALALPRETLTNDSVHSWKLGHLNLVTESTTGNKSVIVTEQTGKKWPTDIHRTIAINLQSLDHLVSFGVLRFQDIQYALRDLTKLVERVATSYNLCQNFYRNTFVLRFAGLFPLVENLYYGNASTFMDPNQSRPLAKPMKCDCLEACTTMKCPNVAANAECTDENCGAQNRCRNRRLQKRNFPRSKLLLVDEIGPYVMIDETVVKDVLVGELVGVVKSTAWAEANFQRIGPSNCVFKLSNEAVIDCSQFCSIFRFIKTSDRPNLQVKIVTVAGFRRIGLFSSHRIVKGDILTLDFDSLIYRVARDSCGAPTDTPARLETWKEALVAPANPMAEELFVIDLCGDDADQIRDDSMDTETIAGRAPLCPECLKELMMPQSRPRVLIHCRICYSVFHYRCACLSIELNDALCNRLEQEARIQNFICQVCTAMRP